MEIKKINPPINGDTDETKVIITWRVPISKEGSAGQFQGGDDNRADGCVPQVSQPDRQLGQTLVLGLFPCFPLQR